jgi:hypothetical protein
MSINWPVALLWAQFLTAVGAVIFVAAWILTGRKNTTLRILGVVFILTTSLIGLYKALHGGAIY